MSVIESNITIDVPDDVDPAPLISLIQDIISSINDRDTHVNITEVNDPLSMSPISLSKLRTAHDI